MQNPRLVKSEMYLYFELSFMVWASFVSVVSVYSVNNQEHNWNSFHASLNYLNLKRSQQSSKRVLVEILCSLPVAYAGILKWGSLLPKVLIK